MTTGPNRSVTAPRSAARIRRVPRRRHRDERARRRALRADRGRRGAGRRGRAARALVLARGHQRAALARDPALHRHQPGDGRQRRRRPRSYCPSSPRLLHGRVLVAHSARFDQGVLRQAFSRAALTWPEPPVLCTVALARRFAPLQRRRGLASLADALGIEVAETHRALPDAETCARVFCALFARLCANAATVGDALAALRRAPHAHSPQGRQAPAQGAPGPQLSPQGPWRLRVPRRRRPPALRRQVRVRAHARALALHDAGDLDGPGRARRLRADGVRARRARAREPADQGAQAARQRARQAHRGRLRVPALPARHRVPDPRGRARAARPATASRSARPGPAARCPSSSSSSTRCSACATAAGRCTAAVARRPTARWAAVSRPASAISIRTSTASGSTRR